MPILRPAGRQLRLMASLGFDRFDLAGHDRGARVSHRLALDAPQAVKTLALLDIVPTRHMLNNVDRAMASAYWHWFFLALGNGIPERLVGDDPEFFLRSLVAPMQQQGSEFDPGALAEYIRCFSDPATIAASCADYRAAATIDLEHDAATAEAGQRLECPALVLWGEQGFVGRHYDVPEVWRAYASDVRGFPLPANHFLAEEVPGKTLNALREFLG
jgi:haloacetate dehalogenase